MKYRYLTIEREYGSGGTEIGRRLSEKLGIPCFGREILEEVSKERHVSIESIEHCEETVTNSLLYSVYLMSQAVSANPDMLPGEGHIYVEEQKVIRRFAAAQPAIFVGHCASEALKEYPNVVNVFIHCSSDEQKKERILHDYGIAPVQADVVRRKYDKKRANYYKANTERKWDNFRDYDLVLDSAKLGIDGCVDALYGLMTEK